MDNQAPARPDNLFGVCHALADSFGIDPLLLRLAFAGAFVIDFKVAVLAYAAGGLAVAAGVLFGRPWRRRPRAARSA